MSHRLVFPRVSEFKSCSWRDFQKSNLTITCLPGPNILDISASIQAFESSHLPKSITDVCWPSGHSVARITRTDSSALASVSEVLKSSLEQSVSINKATSTKLLALHIVLSWGSYPTLLQHHSASSFWTSCWCFRSAVSVHQRNPRRSLAFSLTSSNGSTSKTQSKSAEFC